MVKKFLKIAGVKTEAEFYKKYPSEAAFFKAHPEAKDLKQYKQGGQQKKLKQLTSFEGDIDNIMPTAQYGDAIGSYTGGEEYTTPNFVDIDRYTNYYSDIADMKSLDKAKAAVEASTPTIGNTDGITNMLKGMGGSGAGAGSMKDIGASAGAMAGAKKGKKVKRAQVGATQCPEGFMYDTYSTECVPDPNYSPQGGQAPAQTNNAPENFEYEEQQKFNVNPNLSGQTAKTGPGTGVNPVANAAKSKGGASGTASSLLPNYNYQYKPKTAAGRYFQSAAPALGVVGLGYKAFDMARQSKQAKREAEQRKDISGLTLQASLSQADQQQRKYVRPEDALIQPEQLFPTYGVGTNVLTAKDGSIIKAQRGLKGGFGCKGDSKCITGSDKKKKDGISDSDGGGMGNYVPMSNAPATWDELQTYNQTNPKSKEFKAQLKSLQTQFPGLTQQQLLAAGADSVRVNLRKQDLKRYDQPSEQTFDRAYHMFYRPLMDQQQRVTVPQILQQQPGGFSNFEQNVRGNYGRKKAEDGMQIGGNMTEIQNMYNPGDLYDDLGYEPLNDSDIVKQYAYGGIRRAQDGYNSVYGDFAESGGQQAGKIAGQAFGSAIGMPGVGAAVGEVAGRLGGAQLRFIAESLDTNAKKTKEYNEAAMKNIRQAAMNSAGQAIRSNYSNFVKNGGWVSNDWQPQVITKFGEYDVKDLLKEDPMMDTLRTGGHISQNKMFPTDQYGLGGELKTTWGGYAETMSQNPYLPGTGETVMFRGNSHEESDGKGRTGIGVNYGGGDDYSPYMEYGRDGIEDKTHVEVEDGEPAIEMTDGSGEKNMVVFGNLKIPNNLLNEIGDPIAKGKRFKTYTAALSKKEEKINKSLEKDIKQLDILNVETPFDKLKMDALTANVLGKNMKLQGYADFKMSAAAVQSALNDTAEEYGVDADALAKGKVKIDKKAQKDMARFGKEIFKAQAGTSIPPTATPAQRDEVMELYREARAEANRGNKKSAAALKLQEKFHEYFPDYAMEVILDSPTVTKKAKNMGIKNIDELKKQDKETILKTNLDEYFGPRTEQYIARLKKDVPKAVPIGMQNAKLKTVTGTLRPFPERKEVPKKQFPYEDYINEAIAAIRPTDADYSTDIYPEMMALSMNQLEPVDAQGYQPQLLTPYDISYQDQLNEVTAQTIAAERMAGQDPAIGAVMSGEADRRKSSILGEQFRQNQAQRMGVYNQNIATLNDAQMKNLAIYEEQAKKQAMARSNTKAQAIEAAKSISDKIAKNKLENKTLQVYENLYNYRFDPRGRAINYNPLAKFSTTVGQTGTNSATGGLAPGYEFTYDASGNIIGTRKSSKSEGDTGRNGKIVRAMKGF